MANTPAELIEVFKKVDPEFEPNTGFDTEDQVVEAFKAFLETRGDEIEEVEPETAVEETVEEVVTAFDGETAVVDSPEKKSLVDRLLRR
jgi:hypothetical protein